MNFSSPIPRILFLISALCFISITGYGQKHRYSEKQFADYIQSIMGGDREVSVPNGRADLVTETHAIEVEFAEKWKNSLGQSLWYAFQTNKKAGIIIIMESNDDNKYVIMLQSLIEHNELSDKIDLWVFPQDFD